jgi:hypothetical protein
VYHVARDVFFFVAVFFVLRRAHKNGHQRVPLRWKLEMRAFWLLSRCADLFLQLLLFVVLASADVCTDGPPGYSDTGCYLMGTRQYCPELVARPYWYQSMPDKSLLDARIAQIMSNPSTTGTACCLRPLSGRNKGTSEVVCATGRAPTPPRVRPVTPAPVSPAAPPAPGGRAR